MTTSRRIKMPTKTENWLIWIRKRLSSSIEKLTSEDPPRCRHTLKVCLSSVVVNVCIRYYTVYWVSYPGFSGFELFFFHQQRSNKHKLWDNHTRCHASARTPYSCFLQGKHKYLNMPFSPCLWNIWPLRCSQINLHRAGKIIPRIRGDTGDLSSENVRDCD